MRKIFTTALAALTVAGSVMSTGIAPAAAQGRNEYMRKHGPHFGPRYHGPRYGYRPMHGPRYGYRHRHYNGGYGYGGSVAGGILGFTAGAIVGNALSNQYSSGYSSGIAYCESRFRSYDRASGTYLGYDGRRHACP